MLDAAGIEMPVQWAFKDRRGNGAYVEVFLRRVKAGNEEALHDENDGGFSTHLKGKFSDAQTLEQRFNDPNLTAEESHWMIEVTHSIFEQMTQVLRHSRPLLELFARKGKLEIYGHHTQPFHPQYISGNFTLKIHASSFRNEMLPNLFAHMIAQHLDYPFGPGERRFSTSRLFDLCFMSEKLLDPKSLATEIDARLQSRGIYQPERHTANMYDHVMGLLEGDSASIGTSYERVLQRERFAAMVVAFFGTKQHPGNTLTLSHYKQLVDVSLLAHQQADYKEYPPKKVDAIAEAIHVPLAMIFNSAGKHDIASTQ